MNTYTGLSKARIAEILHAMSCAAANGTLRIREVSIADGVTTGGEKTWTFKGEQFGPILLEGW